MQVSIDKQYPVDASLGAAWRVLADMPQLASCMPGAQITEQVDATHYKGSVKVKVGPANATFSGDIEVLAVDAAARTLRLLGKGADRGGSSASMELTASLVASEGGHCTLVGQANVVVTGKFAQFGGRMMDSVSDLLLGQFAATFSEKARALQPADAQAQVPTTDAAAMAAAVASGGPGAMPASAATPAPNELNALALLWSLLRRWVAGLFGRKA